MITFSIHLILGISNDKINANSTVFAEVVDSIETQTESRSGDEAQTHKNALVRTNDSIANEDGRSYS